MGWDLNAKLASVHAAVGDGFGEDALLLRHGLLDDPGNYEVVRVYCENKINVKASEYAERDVYDLLVRTQRSGSAAYTPARFDRLRRLTDPDSVWFVFKGDVLADRATGGGYQFVREGLPDSFAPRVRGGGF